MSCLWTKLYTRLMYPVDCTMMTGVYSVRLYETVLGTALGCAYSLGGVQPGGLALHMRMTRIFMCTWDARSSMPPIVLAQSLVTH